MPWEKSFDIDQATGNAMRAFWAKGYEATSLADLLKATGINKGSFYNAFGSKKKLFMECLSKYDRENRLAIITKLSALQDPVAAIAMFFDILIEQNRPDSDIKGCLIVNTALDFPHHDDDTVKIVETSLKQIELFFKAQIEHGHESGTISKTVSPATTAKGLLTLLVGLHVLARGVFDHDSLLGIKKQALALIEQ